MIFFGRVASAIVALFAATIGARSADMEWQRNVAVDGLFCIDLPPGASLSPQLHVDMSVYHVEWNGVTLARLSHAYGNALFPPPSGPRAESGDAAHAEFLTPGVRVQTYFWKGAEIARYVFIDRAVGARETEGALGHNEIIALTGGDNDLPMTSEHYAMSVRIVSSIALAGVIATSDQQAPCLPGEGSAE